MNRRRALQSLALGGALATAARPPGLVRLAHAAELDEVKVAAPLGLGHASEISMIAAPQPFRLTVDEAAIADLRERLARTRFPDQAPGEPWTYGTDLDYLRGLVAYWQRDFDWRAQETALNAFPQYKLRLADIDVHFLHVPGNGPAPCPLLLLHGWPGLVFEFLDLIPRLADPARFGGDSKDAFTIVAPSLLRPVLRTGTAALRRQADRRHDGRADAGARVSPFRGAGRRLGRAH